MTRSEVAGDGRHDLACGRRLKDLDVLAELEEVAYGVADPDGNLIRVAPVD